jgi:hypothetical protein
LLVDPSSHFSAVAGIAKGAGAHRNNFLDVHALATLQVALQNF